MSRKTSKKRFKGFSLTELLIALMIIGEIATFTIPKVLTSSQNHKFKSIIKESAGNISAAYQVAQLKGGISGSSTLGSITPYLNYVKKETALLIDDMQDNTTLNCSSANCLRLHDGSVILYWADQFGGTATTNATWYVHDPDGKVTDGTTNGPGKGVGIFLYYNGKLRSAKYIESNTMSNGFTYNPVSTFTDPPWFSWD
jgi:prepilin-type N-terminal cleavage/methylation domain-containing protein